MAILSIENSRDVGIIMSLYIVIPAYNEQENILDLIDDWYPLLEKISDAHILVIDDGSTDDTNKILRKLKGKCPKLEVSIKKNGGHGASAALCQRR